MTCGHFSGVTSVTVLGFLSADLSAVAADERRSLEERDVEGQASGGWLVSVRAGRKVGVSKPAKT